MLKVINRIWGDIKKGENIDAYVSIVLAIVVSILSLVDVIPPLWLTPIMLAILALMANGILGNRFRLDNIEKKIGGRNSSEVLLKSFPPDMSTRFEKSFEIWLVGVTLGRTIKENYALIEAKLKKGDKVKVLIRDPKGDTYSLISRHSYKPMDPKNIKSEILLSLNRLCNLKKEFPENIEIRVLDHHFSMGMFAFDPYKSNGVIYIEYYPFKMPESSLPKIEFHPEIDYWYDFFCLQLTSYWDNSKPWLCDEEVT